MESQILRQLGMLRKQQETEFNDKDQRVLQIETKAEKLTIK
jgi:hypothetical protein